MHCFSQVFVCSQSDVSLLFSQHSATDRSRVANLALCRSIWRLSRERLGNFDRQKRAATNLVTFSALGENVGTDASTFYRQSDVKVRPQLITSMNSGGPFPVSKYCGLWVAGQWYRSLSGTTILQMNHKLAPQNAILDWIGYFTPCLYTQFWSSKQLRVWDCLEIWDIFTAGRFLIGNRVDNALEKTMHLWVLLCASIHFETILTVCHWNGLSLVCYGFKITLSGNSHDSQSGWNTNTK